MIKKVDFSDIVGLPFKDGGTGPTGKNPGGFDCYGLAVEVFNRYGIQLPTINMSVTACCQASQKEIDSHIARSWIRIGKPITPCGVQIKSSDPKYANHIATYIGYGRIIHVTLNTKVIVQRLADYHPSRIEGFYKYVDCLN